MEQECITRKNEVSVTSKIRPLQIPDQLKSLEKAWPIVYLQTKDIDLWHAPISLAYLISDMLNTAIQNVQSHPVEGQVLQKVHIGEPSCNTRMRPEYTMGTSRFLREKGASCIVAGDTTVAYSGPRGHKENPKGNASKYLQLARRHGWSKSGNSRISFIVLDRPSTSKQREFEFSTEQERLEIKGINHFNDFYAAGGFTSADFVINNAHLTLHGLAGLAGCIKSIAMGCSGLTGKLRMHQSLLPHFDSKLCAGCGLCVERCPEDALNLEPPEMVPIVNPEKCIGCGECEAVCAVGNNAIKLCGEDIKDWDRGHQSLPIRMADYTIGLMNGRWESTIHVLHMYAITERCDCLDIKQSPMLKRDLGFLVGKNPFAIDKLAGQLLSEALNKEGCATDDSFLQSVETTADYVYEKYGILTDVPVQTTTAL
jgi:uncharacterized Fe-S center protein